MNKFYRNEMKVCRLAAKAFGKTPYWVMAIALIVTFACEFIYY